MEKILEIDNLSFRYPSYQEQQTPPVFQGLSLEIEKGEMAVIIASPESGKSTLAFIISGLVPEHSGGYFDGSVRLCGSDISGRAAYDLIDDCGVIFQDAEKQIVTTDCFSEAAFALESLGLPEDEIIKRVEASFEFLGISHLNGAGTGEISGGEKKKLALAGVMAVSPSLWILDDSMEELDSPSRRKLVSFLREEGCSVVILTSKFYDIFRNADSFYHLRNGSLSKQFHHPFSGEIINILRDDGIIGEGPVMKKEAVSGTELLAAESIRFSYGEQAGTRGISRNRFELDIDFFSLHEDETVSIVGRNGCGKSTFGRILCGLLNPEQGTIRASGIGRDCDFLNSFCGYMFQNPDYQIFLPTVSDELGWGLKEAGIDSGIIRERVAEAIDIFSLPDSGSPPSMMSFSARKRLQAAVYYLLDRPVYILDEADTGLGWKDFTDLVGRLKSPGRAMIIITHNLELASAVSDRVLGMEAGKLSGEISDLTPGGIDSWMSTSGGSEQA